MSTDGQDAVVSPSLNVFYSYADRDEPLRKKLEKHLSILRRQNIINEWHHRRIIAGESRVDTISAHLSAASVILLLISPDFLASDYCYGIEMQYALQQHNEGRACVIPILLRPVDWREAPFAHLQCVPHNAKPVTSWSNRDEAFLEISQSIRAAIEHLNTSFSRVYPLPQSSMSKEIIESSYTLPRKEILTDQTIYNGGNKLVSAERTKYFQCILRRFCSVNLPLCP